MEEQKVELEVKVGSRWKGKIKVELEKRGIDLKETIVKAANLPLKPQLLKVMVSSKWVKDEAVLSELKINPAKVLLAQFNEKDLSLSPPPSFSPPKTCPKANECESVDSPLQKRAKIETNKNANNEIGEVEVTEEIRRLREGEWQARKTVEMLIKVAHNISRRQANSIENRTFAVLTDSEGKEFPLSETDREGMVNKLLAKKVPNSKSLISSF